MSSMEMESSKLRTSNDGRELAVDELVITRIFDAPRELVWKAWTLPEYFKKWFGPKTYTTPFCQIDLRDGGKYLYCMRSPEGQDYWGTGFYREISAPERLVMTDSFADPEGNIVPATYYGMDENIPVEMLIEITLQPQDGKTRMTLRHTGMPVSNDRELAGQGWNESFDKLAERLESFKSGTVVVPGKPEIIATHVFDAPRELVWKAWTDPELIPYWWGPRHLTTTVERLDLYPGGAWRFIQHDPEGNAYAFHGVYQEIQPPERLVSTFEFEGVPPGHTVVETMTLEDLGGRTRLTTRSVFLSIEDRDAMVQDGMEEGANESMDRLDELLAKLSQ